MNATVSKTYRVTLRAERVVKSGSMVRFYKGRFVTNSVLQCVGSWSLTGLLISATLLPSRALIAEPVAVRYVEGTVHGFLVLRSMEGKMLAAGTSSRSPKGIGSFQISFSTSKTARSTTKRRSFLNVVPSDS